ncbi:conjugative transfer signal peptidase TraF [Skermanella aerolata]|uniref:conjugative transfer signal peptidase TraF n=1 Tax=Skermanella aerolata TaxID=393310 RepID=UPI003D1B7469
MKVHRRSFAILAAVAVMLGGAMALTHRNLRLNLSASMPYGLWWVSDSAAPRRGDYVTLCLLGEPGRIALTRGYIGHGGCPDEAEPLLKPVAAVAGDLVTVTAGGIRVNGEPLANSAPFRNDTEGRPMTAFPAGEYAVDAGMVWVVAGHDPRSYDSRYFGPVATAAITGTARALLIR